MLALLIVTTVFFLFSLYLIFIKPNEGLDMAGQAEGLSTIAPYPEETDLSLHAEQALVDRPTHLESLEANISTIKEQSDAKTVILQKKMIAELNSRLRQTGLDLGQKELALSEKTLQLKQKDSALAEKETALTKLRTETNRTIEELNSSIIEKDSAISQSQSRIDQQAAELSQKEEALDALDARSKQEREHNESALAELLAQNDAVVAGLKASMDDKNAEVTQNRIELGELKQQLNTALAEKRLAEEKKLAEDESLKRTIQDRADSISKLQSDIENYKTEIAEYKEKLLESGRNVSQLGETIQKKNDVVSKLKTRKVISYARAFGITRGLRLKLRKKESELRTLLKIAEENQRLRAQLSDASAGPGGEALKKKDMLISELRKEIDSMNEKHISKISQAKSDIDTLQRELNLREKSIQDLKTERKKEIVDVPADAGELQDEYKKLKAEYSDLKNKSEWLVKLVREETEKNKKLQANLDSAKTKSTSKAKLPDAGVAGAKDKEKEYFLKIYQENLDNVFFNEQTLPSDYESVKEQYLNLMRQAQMISKLLRDEMTKKHKLQDEVFRLKKGKEV